jgi:hypothetical protein
MNESPGANSQATMEGLHKETYARDVVRSVPITRWGKIKKAVGNGKKRKKRD